jgi:hypothetical protein
MVILGVTILMEALQISLIFHSAVRLCPMLRDPMMLFRMFCDLCLSFKHLAYFWPSAIFIDETKNHLPSVSKVPVPLVRMRIRLQEKCFVDKNFGIFCITVISRVLLVVQEGRDLCLGSGEVSSKKGRTRAIKKAIEGKVKKSNKRKN